MVRFFLNQYTRSWEAGADLWLSVDDIGDPKDGEECLQTVTAELLKVREMCAHLKIDCTDNVNRAIARIAQERNGVVAMTIIRELEYAIQKELRGRLCFLMTKEESKLHDRDMVSARAEIAFPHSCEEISEAAECLALNHPRASVFHSMNALESPLGAMARYFAISFERSTWGMAINGIKDKLDVISRKSKRSRQKTMVLQYYGEAAKEFAYFNEAWRVHVMHGRSSHDAHSARSIFDHVVHFIEHLSVRLSDRSKAKCRL